MNKSIVAATLAALFSTTAVQAQQPVTPAKAATAKEKAPKLAEFDKQAEQVQEHIKKMHEQMDKISKTQDPQERQRLLQEHWVTMQSGMGMMRGMWGPGMMGGYGRGHMMGGPMMGGGHMGWGGMRDYYSKLTPEQIKQRQYMMDNYMGMQQQMMDHMMQHQQYMWKQPEK